MRPQDTMFEKLFCPFEELVFDFAFDDRNHLFSVACCHHCVLDFPPQFRSPSCFTFALSFTETVTNAFLPTVAFCLAQHRTD